MISEHDIAQLCLDIYQGQPAQWDQLEVPPDGVAFGIKEYPEGIALICRGSATLQDWLRNAEAIADPSAHQGLGPVHPGFFAGLPELWTRLKPLMVLDGKPPVRRLCFGEPRPGFPQAAGIIANVRSRSYCNANGRAHDLVTDVPFTSWIEDYVHPTPLIPICAPPSDADVQRDIFFAWHAMRLYASATPDIPIV
jgi:hypothetical protein